MNHAKAVAAAQARLAAAAAVPALVAVTLAARKRDPHIGTHVKAGRFTIVRSVPIPGTSDYDVTPLAGPMPGWQAVESLQQFAQTGEL